jgi:hypothetical protein
MRQRVVVTSAAALRTVGYMTFHAWHSRPPVGPPEHGRSRSRLTELLDVRFERRFAPVLVRWLYVGSLALIAAVTLFGLLMSWWLASWAGWGFRLGVPISVAGGLVWALGVRLVCEYLIRRTGPGPHRTESHTDPIHHSHGREHAYPTLRLICEVLDSLRTRMYQHAVVPVALAHSAAALPLGVGRSVLTMMAQQNIPGLKLDLQAVQPPTYFKK